jgi:hypothetical protein
MTRWVRDDLRELGIVPHVAQNLNRRGGSRLIDAPHGTVRIASVR